MPASRDCSNDELLAGFLDYAAEKKLELYPAQEEALLELVAHGTKTKAADLAERVGASAGFLAQAMTPLVARGWVRSEPGPSGGYVAATDLSEVSVLDVKAHCRGAKYVEEMIKRFRKSRSQFY